MELRAMATATKAPSALTAADMMTPGPRTCSPFSTVTEAAALLRDAGCRVLPVVDAGKPVGVVSERDIALAVTEYPDLASRPVSEIMGKDVVSVAPEATLEEVQEKLAESRTRRLLVVNPDETLRGMVSWTELIPHLADEEVERIVSTVMDRDDGKGDHRERLAPPARPEKVAERMQREISGPWGCLKPRVFGELLKATVAEWSEDRVPRLGAALAYYSVLSLAPLLLIAIAVAALIFGDEAAQGQIVGQISGLVGEQGAAAIQSMLVNASKPGVGSFAAIIGLATLLFAASGVFGGLQDALNTIWEVQPKPGRGFWGIIKDRFLSFAMVLGTGFLLLVSMIISAVLSGVFDYLGRIAPWLGPVASLTNVVVSFLVITVLFAMIFKVLPDVEIGWRDVWFGAALTTVLFLIGKWLIGMYLGRSSYSSSYGAAGSLVALLVWIYYSAQILFFGAEFTQVYARRCGSKIEPSPDAVAITEKDRAEQGMPRKTTA
jgi:membrane protein